MNATPSPGLPIQWPHTIPESFLAEVRANLKRDGYSEVLSREDVELCRMAIEYGVGPGDTAYQIEDNRTPEDNLPC